VTAKLSKWIDKVSEFFAARKGLLPLLGLAMVVLNFILRLAVPGWLAESDFFLHLGLILAIFGFMLAWAL
jgi:hypothetical protein